MEELLHLIQRHLISKPKFTSLCFPFLEMYTDQVLVYIVSIHLVFRELDQLPRKNVGKVVVKKVGSGLKHIGKQMVLKPSVVIGDEDDHTLYDIEEADDISLLMVSKEVCCLVSFTFNVQNSRKMAFSAGMQK